MTTFLPEFEIAPKSAPVTSIRTLSPALLRFWNAVNSAPVRSIVMVVSAPVLTSDSKIAPVMSIFTPEPAFTRLVKLPKSAPEMSILMFV